MTEEREGKVAVRRQSVTRPLGSQTGPRQAGDRRIKSSQVGHAMEPPPVIRPAAKPQRATGAVKTIGGGLASDPATVGAPATTSGQGPRSFRTAKVVNPADVEQADSTSPAPSTDIPSAYLPPPVLPVLPETGFAQVSAAGLTAAGPVTSTKAKKGLRRVKLQLRYVSPLSVAKMSFFISLAAGVAFVVMVYVLWHALDNKAVFSQINNMIIDLAGAPKAKELNLMRYVELNRVMSGAMMIGAIDVVIATVLATLSACVYNLLSALVGGVHVTLQEK